jgi:hypothetical protein
MVGDVARFESKTGRLPRNFLPAVPVIVAPKSQSRQKGEIGFHQRPPDIAVRDRTYPSAAVCRRLPVFAAVTALASRVGGNALARRIQTIDARLMGSH